MVKSILYEETIIALGTGIVFGKGLGRSLGVITKLLWI